MTNKLDIRIAPKLDRKTHNPIRAGTGGTYWYVRDYPGHGAHGDDATQWDQNDWATAIDIFEDRIYGRFLNIVKVVEGRLFSGFATMALDCLLCETLQQFYEGVDESDGSAKTFKKFLTTSSFQTHFGNDVSKTGLAGTFYDQIRSGILHMAEVKSTSRLVIENHVPLIDWSDNAHSGVVVNRKKFHLQLVQEFEGYLALLRGKPIVITQHPWKNFKLKMGFICRV